MNEKKRAIPGRAIVAGIKNVKELAGMTFGVMGFLISAISKAKERIDGSQLENTQDLENTEVDPDLYTTNENM
jgi:hypothetical protein